MRFFIIIKADLPLSLISGLSEVSAREDSGRADPYGERVRFTDRAGRFALPRRCRWISGGRGREIVRNILDYFAPYIYNHA